MNDKIEQYGLSAEERKKFCNLWYELAARGIQAEFGSYGKFVEWSLKNGYAAGRKLVAIDFRKPIAPDNAYWKDKDAVETDAQRAARVTLTEHPCDSCPRYKYCDTICFLRKKWWDIGMEKLRKRWGIK